MKIFPCAFILGLVGSALISCSEEVGTTKTATADIVRRSNLVYDSASFQTGLAHVPPYVANGVIGGCFDHMGFQHNPNLGYPNGRTAIGYVDHYYMHHETTRQAQLPLAYVTADFADGATIQNMMDATNYRQELDLYSGTLKTSYDLYGETEITTFAHQLHVGLLVIKINRKTAVPGKELVVKFHCQTANTQDRLQWSPEKPTAIEIDLAEGHAAITSATNMVETQWHIAGNAGITSEGDDVVISLMDEETILKVWVERDDYDHTSVPELGFDELLTSHRDTWQSLWERSWVNLPLQRDQDVWMRANYYNLSNFPVVPEKALIPSGLNSNIWGFTFPQDVYYVAENLLRSGHFDRYKLSMQYWLDILPEVKKYSQRIMDVEGGFYPWTPPFGEWDEFEKYGAVGNDSYEIHNPAYVSAMVWHYFQRTQDTTFLTEYFPIMEEVWRFYAEVSHPNDLGTFDVNHHKAAGQDEASKLPSSKNLLDATYSAEYACRNYLEASAIVKAHDAELRELAKQISTAGYERSRLLNDRGYYVTYEGDTRPINSQKHPVQLNAIAFVPMADLGLAPPSLKAHDLRYDLTSEARKPISQGWTYAEFALASSRLGKSEAFAQDMTAAQFCAHADPRWIQFYEYTFWQRWTLSTAYYFPTHGLYQQAYSDALVQDWQGFTEVFGALMPTWQDDQFSFKGLVTSKGVTVDGTWDSGQVELTMWPNGAESVDMKVSSVEGTLQVQGAANVRSIQAGELSSLIFDQTQPIIISN